MSSLVFHRELQNIYCTCHNHLCSYSVGNFTDGTTDGMNPSVYFQQECFFFPVFYVCKTIGFYFIFLSTELVTEHGITNERYFNGLIPSGI